MIKDTAGPVKASGDPNMCLDGGTLTSGGDIKIQPCNGSPQQTWTWDGTLMKSSNGESVGPQQDRDADANSSHKDCVLTIGAETLTMGTRYRCTPVARV